MPISTTAFGILVNEDLLAELGLTLPNTDSWTWADLQAFATSVSEASGGKVYGISPMNNGYSLQLWARQHGEALFTDGAVSITPATLAGYFQLGLDWTKSGAAAPASHQAEMAGVPLDQSDIATGKQVLAFSQVTQISAYAAAAGDAKFSIVQIPTEDANSAAFSYLKPGMYWTVSAASANTEAAATFVDFMVNSEEAGEIIGTERGIPANPSIRDSISGALTDNEKLAVDFVAKVEQKLGDAPEITPNGGSDLDGTIGRYLQQVIFEQQTPQQAAEAFIAEVQGSIDKAE
jgi:multiple sugar transport system substrate-binding protein